MSYHLTNLGSAARHVKRFADLDGFVPESGDDRQLFTYADGYAWDQYEWEEWCLQADEATATAEAEIGGFHGHHGG